MPVTADVEIVHEYDTLCPSVHIDKGVAGLLEGEREAIKRGTVGCMG